MGFPYSSAGKVSACHVGDLSSTPGVSRSLGKGKCYPLQCSRLEKSRTVTVHGVSKSQTRLSDFHFTCAEKRKLSLSVLFNSLQPHGLQATRLLHPLDFPDKSTGVGCCFLLQGIFPNPGLLHCKQTLYRLSHQGNCHLC